MKNLGILLLLLTTTTFAQRAQPRGGQEGGGGDASEARVNEIREDLIKWINNGGARGLSFPPGIDHDFYTEKMIRILAPKHVVVGFVENDKSREEELRVQVGGIPKTCRGFISRRDTRPHILCNIGRFKQSSEAEQYRLIHHEFAGLASIEQNDGAASDYMVSNQLTDFLVATEVLRLAVKPTKAVQFSIDYHNPKLNSGCCSVPFVSQRMEILEAKLQALLESERFGCTNFQFDSTLKNAGSSEGIIAMLSLRASCSRVKKIWIEDMRIRTWTKYKYFYKIHYLDSNNSIGFDVIDAN